MWFIFTHHSPSLRKVGAGTEAEAVAENCLLFIAGSACVLRPFRSPAYAWYFPQLPGIPHQSLIKKKRLTDLSTDNLMEPTPQLRLTSFQMTLACVGR